MDSLPEGRSPDGLFHVLGNVREWTESLVFAGEAKDAFRLSSGHRFTLGCSWSTRINPLANLAALVPTRLSTRDRDLGFRCAKSERP